MTTRKIRNIIIIIVLSIALIGILIFSVFSQRITMNPTGTVGNTAGNINNDGLFCEYNDMVYFANAQDGGKLYCMAPDESNITKLNELHIQNILAGGKYLYYFQFGDTGEAGIGNIVSSRSFVQCSLNGKKPTTILRGTVLKGQLVDNYLYLSTSESSGISFRKIKIDKSEKLDLANYEINPASANNSIIYYNGTLQDHHLYALNTSNDVSTPIWTGDLWYPIYDNGYVYYMDLTSNYRLCRYSISSNTVEILTEDRVDCYNLGSGYIYYQKNGSDAALICMRLDGSEKRTVAEGVYTNINMTSQYVYFQSFGVDTSYYHSPIGSTYFEIFRTGK